MKFKEISLSDDTIARYRSSLADIVRKRYLITTSIINANCLLLVSADIRCATGIVFFLLFKL